MGITDSCRTKRYENALYTQGKVQKLGIMCVQNDISESDLDIISRIKRYGKEDILSYVVDHCMNIKDCEEVYQKHRLF